MKKIMIGVIALGLSPLAFANGDLGYAPPVAAPAFTPGVYVGLQAGYGMTGWNNPVADIDDLTAKNQDAFAGRVYLGYDFHPNFAIEAGYTYWFTSPKWENSDTIASGNDPWAIDVVGKIKAHIVDNFGLYAKAGIAYLDSHMSFEDVTIDDIGGSSFNVTYGVGAFYDITPNVAVDVSWTRYNGNPEWSNSYIPYMDLFALGVSYKFDLG